MAQPDEIQKASYLVSLAKKVVGVDQRSDCIFWSWSVSSTKALPPFSILEPITQDQWVACRIWERGSRWGSWSLFRFPTRPISIWRLMLDHWNKNRSSVTAEHYFDNGYMRKQPVAVEYSGKQGQGHWPLQYNWNNVEICHTVNQSISPLEQKGFNPFPHNDTFWRPWETSLLKTLWEKEKLLFTSNFSFSHSVF